jgi:hypothetical protein
MTNPKGTKYRKGSFEVPYPWADSDKLKRRYRKGWFDAKDTGYWGDGYGLANTRGRDAYIAGFNAGIRANPRPALRPLPGVFEKQAPDVEPPIFAPPRVGDFRLPYLPQSAPLEQPEQG